MNIGIIKTVSDQYQIVDVDDEDAPLISFHNEFNNPAIVDSIFLFLTGEEKLSQGE